MPVLEAQRLELGLFWRPLTPDRFDQKETNPVSCERGSYRLFHVSPTAVGMVGPFGYVLRKDDNNYYCLRSLPTIAKAVN